jgi:hypothetical protein
MTCRVCGDAAVITAEIGQGGNERSAFVCASCGKPRELQLIVLYDEDAVRIVRAREYGSGHPERRIVRTKTGFHIQVVNHVGYNDRYVAPWVFTVAECITEDFWRGALCMPEDFAQALSCLRHIQPQTKFDEVVEKRAKRAVKSFVYRAILDRWSYEELDAYWEPQVLAAMQAIRKAFGSTKRRASALKNSALWHSRNLAHPYLYADIATQLPLLLIATATTEEDLSEKWWQGLITTPHAKALQRTFPLWRTTLTRSNVLQLISWYSPDVAYPTTPRELQWAALVCELMNMHWGQKAMRIRHVLGRTAWKEARAALKEMNWAGATMATEEGRREIARHLSDAFDCPEITMEMSLRTALRRGHVWHEQFERGGYGVSYDPVGLFPQYEGPLPSGNFTVTYLNTAELLQAESKTMHHCVWSYARKASLGQCLLFHVERPTEKGEEPCVATVEVTRQGVVQCRGICNKVDQFQRAVSAKFTAWFAAQHVEDWFAAHEQADPGEREQWVPRQQPLFGPRVERAELRPIVQHEGEDLYALFA